MSESQAAPTGPFPVPGLRPPSQRTGAKRRIGDVIVQLGFAERELWRRWWTKGRANGVPLGQSLIDAGIVDSTSSPRRSPSATASTTWTSTLRGRPGRRQPDRRQGKARRYQTIPIAFLGEQTLLVATADPANVLALDDITMATGYEVRRAVASPEDVDALIGQVSRLGDSVEEIDDEEDLAASADIIELRDQADEAPVVKLVHSIIADAVRRGASDIHFEPRAATCACASASTAWSSTPRPCRAC